MKKQLTKLTQVVNKVGHTVSKHSPIILTVTGVAGLGATAVLSYKAAKKVEVIVEDIEYNRDTQEELLALQNMRESDHAKLSKDANRHLEELEETFVPMTRATMVKNLAGAVALPVITGVASVSAITLSYWIQNNRIVNLAAALATASAERKYYESKFKKDYGEKEYNKFTTPVAEEEIQYEKNGKKVVKKTNVQSDVPSLHGEWFDHSTEYAADDHEYNMAFIESVNRKLDLMLFRKGYLLMNEMFDELGLPRTKAGAMIGWTSGMSFDLYSDVTNVRNRVTGETEQQIYVKWKPAGYIYDTVEYEVR